MIGKGRMQDEENKCDERYEIFYYVKLWKRRQNKTKYIQVDKDKQLHNERNSAG